MLCAEYDYDTDIAVKQEEAREDKAIEAATNLLKMKLGTPEQIAQAEGLPLEKILELKAQLSGKN